MSVTRGGLKRRKQFHWSYDNSSKVVEITNEKGRKHFYELQEIQNIMKKLLSEFGTNFFPLANNILKLTDGSERMGLGRIILEQNKSNILHAQGSSYLGVVLEECGYFAWNGKHVGIEWKLVDTDLELGAIESRLSQNF